MPPDIDTSAPSVSETPQAVEAAPVEQSAPVETALEPTPRAAVERAFAALDKTEAKPDTQAPTEAKTASEIARDEQGRFAQKQAADALDAQKAATVAPDTENKALEAPSRFTPDAKAAWEAVPLPVKAEVNRALSEMEKGLQQYQERYQSLKPFDDIAQKAGTTIESALTNYLQIERDLQSNPAEALTKIFDYIGISPKQYAAAVMGQPPEQAASQQESITRELRQEVARLQQQLGQVNTSIEQQKENALQNEINQWASTRPRFEELRTTMAGLMTAGLASGLDDAYSQAERLKPAPAAPAQVATPQPQKPDFSAQTQKGQLSVKGSPSAGSNPDYRKPPANARDAVKRALAQVGYA